MKPEPNSGEFIGADGKVELFEFDVLKVTNALPVAGGCPVHLATIEIVGHFGADYRVFRRQVPVYVELGGGKIQACYVTMNAQKGGLTVEQKTCRAIEELKATGTYGTTTQCEAYIVQKTIADGDLAAASLTGK
jgi:hypothetical protein